MERTLIKNLGQHVGERVSVSGWVSVRRDQGKMVFFDFRDRSGSAQGVVLPKSEAIEAAKEVRAEYVVAVEGTVNKRPEKNINEGVQNGDIELEVTAIEILSKAEIPFELGAEITMETRFDHRPFTLRSPRDKSIFAVQATIVAAFYKALHKRGFTDFQAPALVGGDAEGGSEVFEVPDYFGHRAFLATSGQLYKQIMVGVFERVMTIAKTFRAEKSATTRHLSEITQLEFEMAFIQGPDEVMRMLEEVVRDIAAAVAAEHQSDLVRLGTTAALVPEGPFPVLTLREAQKILGVGEEPDLEPEHERQICEWAKKEHGSDFVFITRFPTSKRAFYTMADQGEPEWSLSFDLLFRGLEINSGAQRIHNHDTLVEKMRSKGMDPDKFAFYLEAFKVGMPPHGGCSTGLERLTARMLELPNVKEASTFPRDMNRIDSLLSTDKKEE